MPVTKTETSLAGMVPAARAAPLSGVTLLLVEDSRFAADGLRLLALRGGARLRRAGGLSEARRHLSLYRPDLVLADLGLPDGPGELLIRELAQRGGAAPPVLAISGDPGREAAALSAGAAGFALKPFADFDSFCRVLRGHLPVRRRLLPGGSPAPPADRLALREDLIFVLSELTRGNGAADRSYLAGFLAGLARAIPDQNLEAAASAFESRSGGEGALAALLLQRLDTLPGAFPAAGWHRAGAG